MDKRASPDMPTTDVHRRDALKREAALRAVAEISDGMVLGLGSGSTVAFFLDALAARVAAGLRVVGIPSSRHTAAVARERGIRLTNFSAHRRIDLTVDGADQVERGTLHLIKGLGGALLREKLVASASTEMLVIADETKLVERLGDRTPLPVEIVRFAAPLTIDRLAGLGLAPQLRRRDGKPVISDNGNYLVDCRIGPSADPPALERAIAAIPGVVTTGFFFRLATRALVSGSDGVALLTCSRG